MTTKVWTDNRTGPLGCMAGNLVLGRIQQLEREKILCNKGTVFSTSNKMFIGRVCASDRYLQRDIAHVCNISLRQTQNISTEKKLIYFLFITISSHIIHYWIVPKETVKKVLKNTQQKPFSKTYFLRITKKHQHFFLGDKDITQYHQTIPISRPIQRLIMSSAQISEKGNNRIPISININGHKFKGILTPKKPKSRIAILN